MVMIIRSCGPKCALIFLCLCIGQLKVFNKEFDNVLLPNIEPRLNYDGLVQD